MAAIAASEVPRTGPNLATPWAYDRGTNGAERTILAVMTRNRLRSARFCLPMLSARRLVARQLAATPGLVRYASGVAGPTEFLTLTVWEDKQAMRAFMQSGAHERVMWLFSRWSASFWGMRWEPSANERGAWDGLHLVRGTASSRPMSPLVAAGLLPRNPPRAGPTGPRPDVGAIEPRACGLFAMTAWLAGPRGLSSTLRIAARLRAEAAAGTSLVRWSVGVDWPPRTLILTIWRDTADAAARAATLLGDELRADWLMCWQPGDYEIGHWDGLRLRLAARHAR